MTIIQDLKSKENDIYTSGGRDFELQINEFIIHFVKDELDICLTEEQAETICNKLKKHLENIE